MNFEDIQTRIESMPSDEIEGYLQVLQDQINDIDNKLVQGNNKARQNELDALLESKLMLYEDLFEKLTEMKKARGEAPPKYMGVLLWERFERENKRMCALMDEYNAYYEKQSSNASAGITGQPNN